MNIAATDLVTALLLGLAGSAHCVGMCGGIAALLNLNTQGSAARLAYQLGRITSYTILGALIGGFAGWSATTLDALFGLRVLAALMLIAMGLYLAGWWMGLNKLERAGARLWRPIQRYASRWLPIRRWYHAGLVGLCWGFLPCGLIYSSLTWSATAGSASGSALLMLCFGLGTLPAMLLLSMGFSGMQRWLQSSSLRRWLGLLLIALGLWSALGLSGHSGHLAAEAGLDPTEQSAPPPQPSPLEHPCAVQLFAL